MSEIIAVLENVSYFYPRSTRPALFDINLEIKKGEFFGLIGPTGAGKTTLCCAMNGIVPQFHGGRFFGRIVVAGLDMLEHPISTIARHVGEVFEDPETQLIATSVENEIAFELENLRVPRDEIRRRIQGVLPRVRLEGLEKKQPAELSGGQKQRLAIAAALAARPDLLVLDEPTSQLDPLGAQEVFSTINELNKELGMTILLASHAAEEMAQYADRIGVLSEGKLIAIGRPDEIYSQVELLEQYALRPPQVASTFYAIRQRKVPIDSIPVRLEEGKQSLSTLVNECITIQSPASYPQPEMRSGQSLIHIQNLDYVYPDGTRALHNISLDIHTGEYLLIIGQNGAGKSTLVKHFLNLLKPTRGVVRINGVDAKKYSVSDLAAHIGYIAQNPDNQIFNMTVWDEVSFALKNLRRPKAEVERLTSDSLQSMGLYEFRHMHPLALAKGDRARVVIAAILAMQPDTLIFDEPTIGQDFRGAHYILDLSRKLHQMGKTIVVITHHLYLMPEYAERVILMGKGNIILDAPIRQAYFDTARLQSTCLAAPQSVLLAQELSRLKQQDFWSLTPDELAGCFSLRAGEGLL